MTDEQRLRDALHEIVPTPPERPERGPAVEERVRRHRRRTGAAVTLAAAAVVAAAVALPAALAGDDEVADPAASPSPSTSSPSSPAPEVACPPTPDAEPTGPGTLPDGATAVRLCTGPGTPFDPPEDLLTTDVDALVDTVNAQPEIPDRQPVCQMDVGLGYVLVFGYPDGATRTVTGQLYGCHDLQVGTVTRTNPEAPWRQFIRSLRDQRATLDPPQASAATPGCSDVGLSPVARPGEMTDAVLCVRFETAGEHAPQRVPVSPADLEVLLADRRSPSVPMAPPKGCAQPVDLRLVGVTAWGDLTTAQLWCGLWSDDRPGLRKPGPQAREVLDRLVAQVGSPRPAVDPGSSAEEVVAAYVDLLNAHDRDGAEALGHRLGDPDLPAAYERVDYKLESVRALPTVSAYRDATAVTALYREVVRDALTPYRLTTFTLGRDEDGVLRIVDLEVGEVVETGR